MSLNIGYSEDFLSLPVVLKGTFFTKRRIKYKIIDVETKEKYKLLIRDGKETVESVSVLLGCNKRNIRNWIK